MGFTSLHEYGKEQESSRLVLFIECIQKPHQNREVVSLIFTSTLLKSLTCPNIHRLSYINFRTRRSSFNSLNKVNVDFTICTINVFSILHRNFNQIQTTYFNRSHRIYSWMPLNFHFRMYRI